MSYDLSEWTTVINETMPSAIGINTCEIPILTYPVPAHGRYFRLTAIDHHGYSVALNYLDWHFLT